MQKRMYRSDSGFPAVVNADCLRNMKQSEDFFDQVKRIEESDTVLSGYWGQKYPNHQSAFEGVTVGKRIVMRECFIDDLSGLPACDELLITQSKIRSFKGLNPAIKKLTVSQGVCTEERLDLSDLQVEHLHLSGLIDLVELVATPDRLVTLSLEDIPNLKRIGRLPKKAKSVTLFNCNSLIEIDNSPVDAVHYEIMCCANLRQINIMPSMGEIFFNELPSLSEIGNSPNNRRIHWDCSPSSGKMCKHDFQQAEEEMDKQDAA